MQFQVAALVAFQVVSALAAAQTSQPPETPAAKPPIRKPAQQANGSKAAPTKPPVSNAAPAAALNCAKIVTMIQKRIPRELIVKAIHEAPKIPPCTADDLIALRDAGAGPEIFAELGVPLEPPVRSENDSLPAIARPARKRIVAVEPFSFRAVTTQSQRLFGPGSSIPDAIASMLMQRLMSSPDFLIVERQKLEALQKEIDQAQTVVIRRGSGPRLGKLLGAEMILTGEVVDLSSERTGTNVISQVTGLTCTIFKCPPDLKKVQLYKIHSSAAARVTFKLLDVETGATLYSGEATGESVSDTTEGKAPAAMEPITSLNGTLLADALNQSFYDIGTKLSQAARGLSAPELEIEARVADFTPGKIVITGGRFAAVTSGDRFSVEKITGEIKDPATGRVLGLSSQPVGEMIVSLARDNFSEGPWVGSMAKDGQYLARRKP